MPLVAAPPVTMAFFPFNWNHCMASIMLNPLLFHLSQNLVGHRQGCGRMSSWVWAVERYSRPRRSVKADAVILAPGHKALVTARSAWVSQSRKSPRSWV